MNVSNKNAEANAAYGEDRYAVRDGRSYDQNNQGRYNDNRDNDNRDNGRRWTQDQR